MIYEILYLKNENNCKLRFFFLFFGVLFFFLTCVLCFESQLVTKLQQTFSAVICTVGVLLALLYYFIFKLRTLL